MTAPLATQVRAAALEYAERNWAVFPARDKLPLVKHWREEAATSPETIRSWWRRYPDAQIGLPTGRASGLVVLDVDVKGERNGYDSLAKIGLGLLPATPMAETPSGGVHIYFRQGDHDIRNSAGKVAEGIDVRGAGGYVIAPPSPGYSWRPGLGLEVPLAPVPAALLPREVQRAATAPPLAQMTGPSDRLTRYFAGALESAARKIREAAAGAQERTINGESFAIGTLVAAGAGPADVARRVLAAAADAVPSYDTRRPWRPGEAAAKAERAFNAGLARPREVAPADDQPRRRLAMR